MPNLEEVYRASGHPTHTFVKPQKYDEVMVSIRTPGLCSVIEGPSGIGKTTTVRRVIDQLGFTDKVRTLSARKPQDIEIIRCLPQNSENGIVVVDDFHRLPVQIKDLLSDYMKLLADSEDFKSKLILIGINMAGHQLVQSAHDLGLRIDVFRLETNPPDLIELAVSRGEDALQIEIKDKSEIVDNAYGSFQLAQLLCHKMCVLSGVTETAETKKELTSSLNTALESVMLDLDRQFSSVCIDFARGSKLRREGRAPYLHILKWLSEADDWSLNIKETLAFHSDMKGSVGQVVDKGYLSSLLTDNEQLQNYFHFDTSTQILAVEDTKLMFYLKNIIWRVFAKKVGYTSHFKFKCKYDFALSFAGEDRSVAEMIFKELASREVSCFYDENEQYRILSQDVEDYLGPIYRSDADYILVLQSVSYPTKIWTKFESDNFKERFGSNAVIPIRYKNAQSGFFSGDANYGGLSFNPEDDLETQVVRISEVLSKRLIDDRSAGGL